MSEKISLTCIGCPLGCTVNVVKSGNTIESISGNTCKRGYDYAQTEVLAPVRTVTSTVRCREDGGSDPQGEDKGLHESNIQHQSQRSCCNR